MYANAHGSIGTKSSRMPCPSPRYALHHLKTGRLLLFFNPIAAPADDVPFDTNTFRYEQIGEAADIPGKLRGHLTEILAKAAAGDI